MSAPRPSLRAARTPGRAGLRLATAAALAVVLAFPRSGGAVEGHDATAAASALSHGDPVPGAPALDDYPRQTGLDVIHYRFELGLADDTDEIRGRTTVLIEVRRPGVTSLRLDLVGRRPDGSGGMEVTGVGLDRQGSSPEIGRDGVGAGSASMAGPGPGTPGAGLDAGPDGPARSPAPRALPFEHDGDALLVSLPEAPVGARIAVVIEYAGEPADGLRIGPNKYGERTFFSDNWPNRARHWLPTVDHPYDKATCEFVVAAPAHYQVVSNGLLVEETDRPDGTRVTHWRQGVPIAAWLYVLGVARFAVQHYGDFQGRPLQTWVYARDREAGFYDFAVPTKAAMAFYDDYVGPYAYEKLANVQSASVGGGMEAATAIFYHEDSVTGERTERWRNVIIHEVAHQWFGNAVTESDWDDVWLSEGFTTFFTLLFIEHAYGRDAFVEGLRDARERVIAFYEENPDYRIVHDDLDDMSRVTSLATYQKGAWVLHMLREQIGDEAFRTGIQAYYRRYMNGNASTPDFRREMERVTGTDLGPFIDQWLRQGGNPELDVRWSWDRDAGEVVIRVRQVQEHGRFDLPLEVGLRSSSGALTIHGVESLATGPPMARVREDGTRVEGAELRLPAPDEPVELVLDPRTRTLFEARVERDPGG